jgi:hypothetical protein
MKHIVFLEGGIGSDFVDYFIHLSQFYKVTLLDYLYEDPQRLHLLKELNPDSIFIGTSGTVNEKKIVLIEEFKKLNWIPENVIFFSEDSMNGYLNISRELKNHGVKFYFSPYPIGEPFWQEIDWI